MTSWTYMSKRCGFANDLYMISEAYLGPSQTSTVEVSCKSRLGSKYTSGFKTGFGYFDIFFGKIRSSHSQMFQKNGVLKHFAKFTRKHLASAYSFVKR